VIKRGTLLTLVKVQAQLNAMSSIEIKIPKLLQITELARQERTKPGEKITTSWIDWLDERRL